MPEIKSLPTPHAHKVKDACAYLRLSKPTIYRLVERGLLRPNRATRHLLFSTSELERFLRDNVAE
jgi:excisionase family DNA binding protein